MIAEKTITICGKEVKMRYCAATETGFEFGLFGDNAQTGAGNVAKDLVIQGHFGIENGSVLHTRFNDGDPQLFGTCFDQGKLVFM